MRIGVILASSQANKSSLLFHAVQKYTSGSESINFGCREDDQEKYSYVEISLLVGLLLQAELWISLSRAVRPARG